MISNESNDIYTLRLLSNGTSSNHLQELRNQLGTVTAFRLIVAFLSEQGANMLLGLMYECKASVVLYTSLERAVSEPAGLRLLHDFAEKSNGKFRLYAITDSGTKGFTHTKLYNCMHPDYCVSIIGSANLSLGGLVENNELSTFVVHSQVGEFQKSIDEAFRKIAEAAAPIQAELLAAYQSMYDRAHSPKYHYEVDNGQKKWLLRRFPVTNIKEDSKLRMLKIQLMAYVDSEGVKKVPEKLAIYLPWLAEVYLPVIRTIQHHQRLDPENLWQLAVSSNTYLEHPLDKESLARIMHLYQPRRFSLLSEDFLTHLRKGLGLNPTSMVEFSARDYKLLCASLAKLRMELKLKSIEALAFWLAGSAPRM